MGLGIHLSSMVTCGRPVIVRPVNPDCIVNEEGDYNQPKYRYETVPDEMNEEEKQEENKKRISKKSSSNISLNADN